MWPAAHLARSTSMRAWGPPPGRCTPGGGDGGGRNVCIYVDGSKMTGRCGRFYQVDGLLIHGSCPTNQPRLRPAPTCTRSLCTNMRYPLLAGGPSRHSGSRLAKAAVRASRRASRLVGLGCGLVVGLGCWVGGWMGWVGGWVGYVTPLTHPDDAILAVVVLPLASSSSDSTWAAWGDWSIGG
jgi:hypothetical protein